VIAWALDHRPLAIDVFGAFALPTGRSLVVSRVSRDWPCDPH
jgi:hypothetical protein